jgi:excisionase family DNA binding protein
MKNIETQPELDALITLEEAAELSGLTSRHLRKLAGQGEIWANKLGRNWFTTEQAVQEYLARERKPGPKPKKGS